MFVIVTSDRPLLTVKPENSVVVLQFHLLRELSLPRLPKEFKFQEEFGERKTAADTRPKNLQGEKIIPSSPYKEQSIRMLLENMRKDFYFTGFSYVQRPVKGGGGSHLYRFIFSRAYEMDPKFREIRGNMYNTLVYLLGNRALTKEGGVEVYKNPVADEEGKPIKGKTWLSVNIAEGVFPAQKPATNQKKKFFRGSPKKTKEELDALRFVTAGLKGKPIKW